MSTTPPSIIDALPIHVWELDGHGAPRGVNAAARAYLGGTSAQLMEHGWQVSVHPTDLPGLEARWREALSTGQPFEGEVRLRRAKGLLYRWFLARGAPEVGPTGAIVRWGLTMTDIDDLRRADEVRVGTLMREEKARARAEEDRKQFEGFFRQAPVAIAITRGADHVLSFINQRYVELVGDERQLIGLPVRQRFPELEGQGLFELLDGVFESGTAYVGTEVPARIDRKGDGVLETRYFNFVHQPLQSSGGPPEGIFTLAVDVTDLVLARRAAEEVAAQRDAILRQTVDGIIVSDAKGAITFVNDRASQLHGVARLGVTVDGYVTAYRLRTLDGQPHPPEALPLSRAVLRGETVRDALWRISRPDGTEVVAQGSAAPLRGDDGRPLGAVLVLRDVTASYERDPAPLLAMAADGAAR